VLLTIENTDPACYWLPNYLETLLARAPARALVANIIFRVNTVTKNS